MTQSNFNTAACNAALGDHAHDFLIYAVAECDSTNTQLMQQALNGAVSGIVLVTDNQTAGRGRMGRSWLSSPQHSLTFSLLWRFAANSSAPEALSLVVGLGVQRALAGCGAEALVKWPNDILCDGKKLAGVLIETQPGDIKSVVIGVGINLALPPTLPDVIAAHAIGLDQVLSATPTREQLLATLLRGLAGMLHNYEMVGFAGLRDAWQARHAFHNRDVSVSDGGSDIVGTCEGVNERGELLIHTADGFRKVVSGDISLRPR